MTGARTQLIAGVARRLCLGATLAAIVSAAPPLLADERPFAIYWVPQGGDQRIEYYFSARRQTAPGVFRASFRQVDIRNAKIKPSVSAAIVDCRQPTVTMDGFATDIDVSADSASEAEIVQKNLWWRVCHGVPRKYRLFNDDNRPD
jgi:hypothetical protein